MSTRKGLLGRVFIKRGSGLGVGPAYSLKIEHFRQMEVASRKVLRKAQRRKLDQSRMSKREDLRISFQVPECYCLRSGGHKSEIQMSAELILIGGQGRQESVLCFCVAFWHSSTVVFHFLLVRTFTIVFMAHSCQRCSYLDIIL